MELKHFLWLLKSLRMSKFHNKLKILLHTKFSNFADFFNPRQTKSGGALALFLGLTSRLYDLLGY